MPASWALKSMSATARITRWICCEEPLREPCPAPRRTKTAPSCPGGIRCTLRFVRPIPGAGRAIRETGNLSPQSLDPERDSVVGSSAAAVGNIC
jgi:hypothetical protein